ncbi:sn-glycerol-3-phosphate ABC transporter ATP-binding protein UgpC [Leeia sp. TBRC 13508]|uniref:Sn-glycerol-3-phosphate ABC transporter ATP-binding protein UgpC n=1 Tax=Leeia speluncae TaxID=2884804 RepID=A0ABS8D899_9NEIS|nr:sn-glycerol-3-phosphate ABC transporter ATP-binding protein UgpC [Leeia speluncae]MCB6184434.1 sn-glycerol-3-phosphate ABC transporter ATP-binding protein UgpC [Leeia speluncae]
MSSLHIKNVKKSYAHIEILKEVNIDVDDGEFLVLLGPSGCGKSTLLNAIAGLEPVTSGEIIIDGLVVNDLEPSERDIAMVFQSYALYPTMSVRKNLTFGMKVRGVSKAEQENELKRVASILQLDKLLDRKPSQLSGGQRQRVAMGRAMVREPKIFLFDEPLSNLDAKLRTDMRAEIKKLHQRVKTTTVYVTHDQIEAMTLATKIVIMNGGVVQQIASPQEIYEKPNNLFVAKFIGSPQMNCVSGHLEMLNGKVMFVGSEDKVNPFRIDLGNVSDRIKQYVGKPIVIGFRPEWINVQAENQQLPGNFSAMVEVVEPTGSDNFVELNANAEPFMARLAPGLGNPGEKMHLSIDVNKILFFDAKTEERIQS